MGGPKTASHKAPEHKLPMAHKPAGSKKTKPAFEVPADAGTAESAAGWVFRESEAPAATPSPAAQTASLPGVRPHSMLVAATEVFVLSATSIGFATLAAMRLLEVPIAAGKMILPEMKRPL